MSILCETVCKYNTKAVSAILVKCVRGIKWDKKNRRRKVCNGHLGKIQRLTAHHNTKI